MIDDDWRDYYVDDLKKKLMHNGIVGDYFKSTDELEEEAKTLLSIVEVINNKIEIREKVQSELIWAKVISKIDAKVLNGETRVYERTATTGTAYRRLSNSVYLSSVACEFCASNNLLFGWAKIYYSAAVGAGG